MKLGVLVMFQFECKHSSATDWYIGLLKDVRTDVSVWFIKHFYNVFSNILYLFQFFYRQVYDNYLIDKSGNKHLQKDWQNRIDINETYT